MFFGGVPGGTELFSGLDGKLCLHLITIALSMCCAPEGMEFFRSQKEGTY